MAKVSLFVPGDFSVAENFYLMKSLWLRSKCYLNQYCPEAQLKIVALLESENSFTLHLVTFAVWKKKHSWPFETNKPDMSIWCFIMFFSSVAFPPKSVLWNTSVAKSSWRWVSLSLPGALWMTFLSDYGCPLQSIKYNTASTLMQGRGDFHAGGQLCLNRKNHFGIQISFSACLGWEMKSTNNKTFLLRRGKSKGTRPTKRKQKTFLPVGLVSHSQFRWIKAEFPYWRSNYANPIPGKCHLQPETGEGLKVLHKGLAHFSKPSYLAPVT